MLDVGRSDSSIVIATLFGTRPDGSPYEQAVGFPVILGAHGVASIRACV